jgi:hypothetical protein
MGVTLAALESSRGQWSLREHWPSSCCCIGGSGGLSGDELLSKYAGVKVCNGTEWSIPP